MRFFSRGGRILLAGILPGDPAGHDIITNKNTETYKAFLHRSPSNETGWERLQKMFQIDEFGAISPELNSVYQAGFTGFIIGALYGGIINSRTAYFNFMENNQATAFKSHLDAKRKLQNDFTINFAKGAFKWGWRVSLFTTSYFGIITAISVYREKSSIFEYLLAGSVTGAVYKTSLGPRGMIAGGVIGGVLGGIAGCASLFLMRMSGTTMEEIRYWQYNWRTDRDQKIAEAIKAAREDDSPPPEIFKVHDEKVEKKISLDDIK